MSGPRDLAVVGPGRIHLLSRAASSRDAEAPDRSGAASYARAAGQQGNASPEPRAAPGHALRTGGQIHAGTGVAGPGIGRGPASVDVRARVIRRHGPQVTLRMAERVEYFGIRRQLLR